MPDIYLRHPLHGEKVEHNEAIAQMDKGNGWVQFDPSEAVPVAVEPAVEPAVVQEPTAALPFFLAPSVAVPDAPTTVPPEPPVTPSLADFVKPTTKPKATPKNRPEG